MIRVGEETRRKSNDFALGCPPSLHVCGTVLKIAIQGHAVVGGSERGRLSERARGGRGGEAVKRTSHKERRSGMERSARGWREGEYRDTLSDRNRYRDGRGNRVRGERGVGLPAGGFCIFRESITNSSANISGAWLSAMLGDLRDSYRMRLFFAISRDTIDTANREISNFAEINSPCVIDLDVSSDASRIIVAINRRGRDECFILRRYLCANNFRRVFSKRQIAPILSPSSVSSFSRYPFSSFIWRQFREIDRRKTRLARKVFHPWMRTTMCSSPRSVGRVLVIDYSSSARDVPSSTPTARCQTKRTPFFFHPPYFFSRSRSRTFVLAPTFHVVIDRGRSVVVDARRETNAFFAFLSPRTTGDGLFCKFTERQIEVTFPKRSRFDGDCEFYSVCFTLARS